MRSLFLHKNEPVSLDNAFSDGSPATCRFVNGWFCKKCGCMTEHKLVNHCQTCMVCGTAKVPTLPLQVLELQVFYSTIQHYSTKIEFEAVEKVGPELGEDRNSSWYIMVRSQLHSSKKLDEAIKNAEVKRKNFRKQRNPQWRQIN